MNLTAEDIGKVLNVHQRSVRRRAARESWPFTTETVRGGLRRLYDIKDLPEDIRLRIMAHLKTHQTSAPSPAFTACALPGEVLATSLSSPGNPAVGGLTKPPAAPFIENDLVNISETARRRAFLWERIIGLAFKSITDNDRTRSTEHFIAAFNAGFIDTGLRAEAGRISRGTLYRKMAAYKKDGLAGLVPNYKGRERDIHPEVGKKAIAYFMERPRKIRRILDYLRGDFPAEIVPSYSALVRFLNAWGAEHPQEICMALWGEHRWKKKYLAAFGSASEDAPYPNHTWEIDSTVADIMTSDNKRHKLVACIDVHARFCPSITIQPKSNAWGVVDTLARGFEKYGIPERLKKDNGKDYASKWVAGFLRDLSVEVPKLAVKAAEKKPHIERFFRDVSEKLLAELTGYVGNSIVTRPEVIKVNYTTEEFAKILESWVEHEYNEATPSTTGQPRRERFFAPGWRMRKVTPGELEMLTHPQYTRRVGKKGISLDARIYTAPELVSLVGRRVTVRLDINDISRLAVYQGSKLHCYAVAHGAAKWSMEQYISEKKVVKSALKQFARAEKKLAQGGLKDRMLKHLNDKEAESPLRFPAAEDITKIIDISKCSIKEPPKPKTPYDEFPEVITEMPNLEAYLNYQYLRKAEVLGIPLEPHILKWRDDYINGRIEFLERDYYTYFVKYRDDPHYSSSMDTEVEMLREWVTKYGGLKQSK